MDFFNEFVNNTFTPYEADAKTAAAKEALIFDLTQTYSNYRGNSAGHEEAMTKTIANFSNTEKYTANLKLQPANVAEADMSAWEAYFALYRASGLFYTLLVIIIYIFAGYAFDLWTTAWVILPIAFIIDRIAIFINRRKR